jgi:hypothetical protein
VTVSFDRRRLLTHGAAATTTLLAHPWLAAAQEATPVATPVASTELTEQERGWLAKARRYDENGWIHITIGGAPFERGFQHGYLTAAEYAEAIRVYTAMTYQTTGFDYSFFVNEAAKLQKSKITPELLEEMAGISAGYTKAGVPTTVDEIIGWNAYMVADRRLAVCQPGAKRQPPQPLQRLHRHRLGDDGRADRHRP